MLSSSQCALGFPWPPAGSLGGGTGSRKPTITALILAKGRVHPNGDVTPLCKREALHSRGGFHAPGQCSCCKQETGRRAHDYSHSLLYTLEFHSSDSRSLHFYPKISRGQMIRSGGWDAALRNSQSSPDWAPCPLSFPTRQSRPPPHRCLRPACWAPWTG